MFKINKVVEVHAKAFRDSSVDGIRVDLSSLKVSDWLSALLTELVVPLRPLPSTKTSFAVPMDSSQATD